MKGVSGMMYAIQQCFNNAFVRHLRVLSEVEDFFANQWSHQWRKAMKDYLEKIITELPKVIVIIVMTDAPEDSEEYQMLQCLQWSVTKVKIFQLIMSFLSLERLVSWIPFMSWSVFDCMVTHLTKISEALQEVSCVQYVSLVFFTMPHLAPITHFETALKCMKCHACGLYKDTVHLPTPLHYCAFHGPSEMHDRLPFQMSADIICFCPQFCRWWKPLIDMVPVIGKYWLPGSSSAAMVRALLHHHDLSDIDCSIAIHAVCSPSLSIFVTVFAYSHFLIIPPDHVRCVEQLRLICKYAACFSSCFHWYTEETLVHMWH